MSECSSEASRRRPDGPDGQPDRNPDRTSGCVYENVLYCVYTTAPGTLTSRVRTPHSHSQLALLLLTLEGGGQVSSPVLLGLEIGLVLRLGILKHVADELAAEIDG